MNDQHPRGAEGSAAMHDLVGAYVLDAVDARERALFEEHLAGCASCQREVAELSEPVTELSAGLGQEPPPKLRGRLLAQIANEPQDDVSAEPSRGEALAPDELAARRSLADSQSRGEKRGGRRWLVAAAAAAAVAIGAVVVTQWGQDTPDEVIVAASDVLEAPDAVRSSEQIGPATLTVVTSASLDASALVAEEMDPAPQDQDYQLWFVHEDGTAVSAGLMPHDDSGSTTLLLEGEPGGAIAVGVTLEPSGGSEQPTSDPIVAVPLEG